MAWMEDDWLYWKDQFLEHSKESLTAELFNKIHSAASIDLTLDSYSSLGDGSCAEPMEPPLLVEANNLHWKITQKCKIKTDVRFKKRKLPKIRSRPRPSPIFNNKFELPLLTLALTLATPSPDVFPVLFQQCQMEPHTIPTSANIYETINTFAQLEDNDKFYSTVLENINLPRNHYSDEVIIVQGLAPEPVFTKMASYGWHLNAKIEPIPSTLTCEPFSFELALGYKDTPAPVLKESLTRPKYPRLITATKIDTHDVEPLLFPELVTDLSINTPQVVQPSEPEPQLQTFEPIQVLVNRTLLKYSPLIEFIDSIQGTRVIEREFCEGIPVITVSEESCLFLMDEREFYHWGEASSWRSIEILSTMFKYVCIIVFVECTTNQTKKYLERQCLEFLKKVKSLLSIAVKIQFCQTIAECYNSLCNASISSGTSFILDAELTSVR
jgi:hypothetical protein